MEIREGLYYTKDHEWVRVEGNRAYVGITDYAQDSLGSIVYVELPEEGKALSKDEVLGVVESVKAASDIFAPISGTVVEVNEALADNPELINESPYENYMAVLSFENKDELNELLSPAQYEELTKGE
ncbi:MAG TPA: glycine cleavage system protein GcvH [Clostridiaceae bacterium]|jgi:glycine cleavage system H protein|nr:glycine cleavage system protein GcvH [Clostridiaceae bacterium]